jgi:hypothetical protein
MVMKKLLFTGILVLLCSISFNQAFGAIGLKAGLVRANQNYTYTEADLNLEPKYISGIDVGVSFEFLSFPFFGFLIEGHYLQKGMTVDFVDTTGPEPTNTEINNKINYLAIPVLAKISLGGLYAIGGPRLDVLISKDIGTGFDTVYDDFETFVTGYDIGIGYQLGIIPTMSPLIELRYSGDFKDSYESETLSINNKSFQVLVGIIF